MELASELLIHASRTGDLDVLNELIKGDADVNLHDPKGYTPLMIAAFNGHIATAELLIENGANLNPQHENGNTALLFAVQQGNQEAIDLLTV
jgi:ankyrin repeat protein